MIGFETEFHTDDTNTTTWKASFASHWQYDADLGDYMLAYGSPVGIGDTELKAIGNLCLDEDKRITDAAEKAEREARHYAARMAPMTKAEWYAMCVLHLEGNDLSFDNTRPLELLQAKGYVTGIRFDGPRAWKLTTEGDAFMWQWKEQIDYKELSLYYSEYYDEDDDE